jgi:hypothetical protein
MVTRGETQRCQEFFPLLPWLSGISLKLAGADLPVAPPPFVRHTLAAWLAVGPEPHMTEFFYRNRLSHDRALFFARLPALLSGLLLCLLLWRVCSRRFGTLAGVAAVLACLVPELLAHSQWTTHDALFALLFFAVVLALERALEAPSLRRDLAVGALLGLALGTKLPAVLLVPVVVIAYSWKRPRNLPVVIAVAWLSLTVLYLPRPEIGFNHPFSDEDAGDLCGPMVDTFACRVELGFLRHAPLPDAWLRSWALIRVHERLGHASYLHGQVSERAQPGYLAALLLFKYPPAWLLLLLLGAVALWRDRWRFLWLGPPALLLASGAFTGVIWARHLLPLVPFVAFGAGALVAAGRHRWLPLSLASLCALSGLLAYPNFLSYFSLLGGGTRGADRWLSDSNLDWGQDLPALAAELRRRGIQDVALAYFGTARPEEWGIRAHAPGAPPDWYAVSRTLLVGLYRRGDPYAWLRARAPEALPGGSIALYHVTDHVAPPVAADGMEAGLDLLYRQHDPRRALAEFDKLLAADPHHYGALYQRAMALEAAGERDQARPAWRKFLQAAEQIHDEKYAADARAHLQNLGP